MKEGILYTCHYGSVCLRLGELMDQRGINRNQIAKLIGVRFEVADKWYRGEIEKMDLDILARLCFVMDCQPGDFLEYQPPQNQE